MSDLAATNCGCASNDNGCSWIIILLLLCCCCGNGNGFGGFGGGCGDSGCSSIIWIILRMRFLKHCITKPFHSPITITKSMLCNAGEG